jgi:hypothetical protein
MTCAFAFFNAFQGFGIEKLDVDLNDPLFEKLEHFQRHGHELDVSIFLVL